MNPFSTDREVALLEMDQPVSVPDGGESSCADDASRHDYSNPQSSGGLCRWWDPFKDCATEYDMREKVHARDSRHVHASKGDEKAFSYSR
jgi:hypothetical protein